MDGNRFDDIARKLAVDTSRRSFLKRAAVAAAALASLGGASATDAARRPTPTPKPLNCPYPTVPSGAQCVCPGGTIACGPDCCGADSQCCDNACCFGTCYSEELCCPAGQIVCNGVCLAPGQCCTNDDCGPGFACVDASCLCQATTSCASAGLNCGAFTDDCGAIHDCGGCTEPQTCGGGGTAGVCGCMSSTTCEGHCGTFVTDCGETLECGDTCGPCQTCDQNTCVKSPDNTPCEISACVQDAICLDGVCSNGRVLPCPDDIADRCNRSECDSVLGCIKVPVNEGGACTDNPCSPGACVAGTCTEKEMECPPCQRCQGSTCAPSDDGGVCGDGLHCFDGNCCNMPTIDGVVPSDPNVLMGCAATDSMCCGADEGPCCPGTTECCDMCVTVEGDGGRPAYNMCCPADQQCGEGCCWHTDVCVGNGCYNRSQVCAGNVVCNDKCCGGNGDGSGECCGPDAFCVNDQCLDRQSVSCTSHESCASVYGSNAVCANMSINLGTGEINPGTCCPAGYWSIITSGSHAGQYSCCDPETRPSQFGCCPYPDYDCPSCTCSTTRVRRWGR
ncbi:MAG: twin-arginine translocation signal domain-containing protein [Thermomicrobiales bacterium]|nr:MAG: twin-arginine translocation signal domain-containing protein [Thermomicrobiales bacterium]